MLESWDIFLRITAATAIGAAIGLDRNLHDKDMGLRTMAMIGGSSAALVLVSLYAPDGRFSMEAMSRVVQGVLAGLGFLGAGVIILGPRGRRVRGLTTAATVWTTAILGILCGNGAWVAVVTLLAWTLLILLLGGPFENVLKALIQRLSGQPGAERSSEAEQAERRRPGLGDGTP